MKVEYIEKDTEFQALAGMLDKCSQEHNGCEKCYHLKTCREDFDNLTNVADKKMTPEDRARFERRYYDSQTTFV